MLGDVGDFVAQTAASSRFALRGEQQAGVHPDEAAGHREGVDVVVIEREELEAGAWLGAVLDQLVAGPG